GEAVAYISELFRRNTWDSVAEACACLSVWLDQGDLHRDRAVLFHTMLQTAYGHVRRLLQEKARLAAELQDAVQLHRIRLDIVLKLMNQIRLLLEQASKQRHLDLFSKPQRKNLLTWLAEIKGTYEREQSQYLSQREEDEMDLDSDTERDADFRGSAAAAAAAAATTTVAASATQSVPASSTVARSPAVTDTAAQTESTGSTDA
uniref:Utp12 domain-containing protein n=2 Tax=Macrostomum lignano TaxID=282301 RepID=A0A1I8HTY5_9PLAT